MSRVVAAMLALCLGCSTLAYFVFDIAQFEAKSEAQQNIKARTGLSVLQVPLKEFDGNSDEIWYNGRLYDVGSYAVQNDTVYLSVFHDNAEESLVQNISSSFERNSCTPGNQRLTKHPVHFTDDGKILAERYTVAGVSAENSCNPVTHFCRYIPSAFTSVDLQPPRHS